MEMDNNQYNISDLRHFITRTTSNAPHFSPYGQQQSLLPDHMTAQHHHLGLTSAPAAAQQHHYGNEMVVLGRHMVPTAAGTADGSNTTSIRHYHDHFNSDSNTATATTTTVSLGNNYDGGDGGVARWPRQETLTLLEIRSRLDHKFKEANQKGPLWDEVARIMGEEHGYQRSGKKCREKFENLYKYYKKTREGKAGRQDGKHYRFFRQLEALYGEHHHPNSTSDAQITENTPHYNTHAIPPQPTSVSLSNSSDFETSSSEYDDLNNDGSMESKKDKKRSWKGKIKEFIDFQMRKAMEKQETWLEKMMNTLESRENERIAREEEWRKQEVERVEREHKFWANERAWIEARDSALMSALDKLTNTNNNTTVGGSHQWPEHEVTRLIQVRTSMESRFQQCGFSDEVLWEDIATKMAYFGYDRTPIVCKEKWDNINNYFRDKSTMIKAESKKKRKENYGGIMQGNNHNNEGGIYMNQLNGFNNNCEINNETRLQLNEGSSSPSSHNSNVNVNANNSVTNGVGNVMNDSCLRFFLGDGDSNNLGWESNYGLKLNNGGNQCT